jgi:hypothetical protein
MAFLPLPVPTVSGQTRVMDHFTRRAARAGKRLIRAVAAAVVEMHFAGRRLSELTMAPDSYLTDPDTAPDTYQEFLFRTSGGLVHEGSARQRAR